LGLHVPLDILECPRAAWADTRERATLGCREFLFCLNPRYVRRRTGGESFFDLIIHLRELLLNAISFGPEAARAETALMSIMAMPGTSFGAASLVHLHRYGVPHAASAALDIYEVGVWHCRSSIPG